MMTLKSRAIKMCVLTEKAATKDILIDIKQISYIFFLKYLNIQYMYVHNYVVV